MPKVTYQTDQGPKVINFASQPTAADIESVATQQGWKPATQAPTTNVAAAPSGGFDINKPAYDMAENTSGLGGTLAKETVNIAKSGLKFGKGVVDFFNPYYAVKKIAEVPGALMETARAQTAATQSQAQAQAMEAKVNQQRTAAGMTAKAPVAPNVGTGSNILGELAGATYKTIVPEAAQLALKGDASGALTSLANDSFQIAPLLLAAKSFKPTEAAIDTGIGKVKQTVGEGAKVVASTAKDLYAKIPEQAKLTGTGIEAVDNLFKGKPLETQLANLDKTIQTGISKGVKPTVVGKRTLGKSEAFYEKSTNAVKNIADMKDEIKVTDVNGEAVEGAPKTVAQGAQATDQGMSLVWKKSEAVMKAAGEKGAEFDPAPTVVKLRQMSRNLGNSPEIRNYAKGLIPEVRELAGQNPEIVAQRIAEYNKSLQGYYKGNVTNAKATVDAAAAATMREGMDASIEKVLEKAGNQDLRNQYGEMKALDTEMQHRAVVVARQAPKSLFGGITDAGAIAELVRGVLRMNPTDLATSFAIKGLGEYVKRLNSPDANVAKMFKAAYEAKDAAQAAGFKSLRDLTPKAIQEAKALEPTVRGLAEHAKTNGGITVDFDGNIVKEGYAVSLLDKANETRLTMDKNFDTMFLDTFKGLKAKYGDTPNANMGGWVDANQFVVDVSSVTKDLKQSIYDGIIKKQDAVGDLGKYAEGKDGTVFISKKIIDSLEPLPRGRFESSKSVFRDWQEAVDYYKEKNFKGNPEYEKIIGNDGNAGGGNPPTVRRENTSKSPGAGTVGRTGQVKGAVRAPKAGVASEFKVGDVLDPQGKTNMVGKVTIREIKGNTLKFVDSEGTEFAGMQRSLVRTLVKEGSWKKEAASPTEAATLELSKKKDIEIGNSPTNKVTPKQRAYIKNLTPEQKTAYLDYNNKTAEVWPEFQDTIKSIQEETGAKVKTSRKRDPRSIEKAMDDYNGDFTKVSDMNRSEFYANTMVEAKDLVSKIQDKFKVSKLKNRIVNPTNMGYRDVMFKVDMPNGTKAEVQVLLPKMQAAKKALHQYYEITRSLDNKMANGTATPAEIKKYDAAWKKQLDGYNKAWESYAGEADLFKS